MIEPDNGSLDTSTIATSKFSNTNSSQGSILGGKTETGLLLTSISEEKANNPNHKATVKRSSVGSQASSNSSTMWLMSKFRGGNKNKTNSIYIDSPIDLENNSTSFVMSTDGDHKETNKSNNHQSSNNSSNKHRALGQESPTERCRANVGFRPTTVDVSFDNNNHNNDDGNNINGYLSTSQPPSPSSHLRQHSKSFRNPKLAIIESQHVQFFFLMPLLLVSIFLYDSWIISNPPDSQDIIMDVVLIIMSAIFFLETLFYSFYEPPYRTSFFLLLDLVSCLSLLFNLSWVHDRVQGMGDTAHWIGQTRAVKLFARYGRILRLVKFFRNTKQQMMPYIFNNDNNNNEHNNNNNSLQNSQHNMSMDHLDTISNAGGGNNYSAKSFYTLNNDMGPPSPVSSPGGLNSFNSTSHSSHVYAVSRSSYEISRQITLRVAMMVAVLAVIAPILTYRPADLSVDAWMFNLQYLAETSSTTSTLNNFQSTSDDMSDFYSGKDLQLLSVFVSGPYLTTPFETSFPDVRSVVRSENKIDYELSYSATTSGSSSSSSYQIKVQMDETYKAQMESVYFLSLALLVMLLLFSFTVSFQSLLDTYLVEPLTKMIISLKSSARMIMKNVRAMSRHFGQEEEDEDDDDDDRSGNNDDDNQSVHNVDSLEDLNNHTGTSSSAGGRGVKFSFSLSNSKKERRRRRNSRRGSQDSGDFHEFQEAGEDEIDMAATMERMVEKLSRLVKHMLPGAGNIELEGNSNIDQATATWLNANYTHTNHRKSVDIKQQSHMNNSMDFELERKRLQMLAEHQTTVSLELLNSWNFDVLNYSNEQLCEVLTYLFSVHNFFVDFQVPAGAFSAFIMEICGLYHQENSYHNFKHGCDVCHTTHRYLAITKLSATGGFSKLEIFSVLVAALGHDVGHPGVNNIFLVKAKDELALRHNDKSPLENMHCSVLYEILSKPSSNIFAGLTEIQWRESRKVILTTILGTDMVHHFEQINKAQVFLEVNGKDIHTFCRGENTQITCLAEDFNRLFMLELLLHSADISNPCKPFVICEKWSTLVVEEFAQQGDREKAAGLEVSPMMDREKIVLCNMQLGFIEFVVTPLVSTIINIFPPLFEIGVFMTQNYANWCDKRKTEIMKMPVSSEMTAEMKIEECWKLDERVDKYRDKMSFLNKYQVEDADTMQVSVSRKNRRSSTNVVSSASRNSNNNINGGGGSISPPASAKMPRRTTSVLTTSSRAHVTGGSAINNNNNMMSSKNSRRSSSIGVLPTNNSNLSSSKNFNSTLTLPPNNQLQPLSASLSSAVSNIITVGGGGDSSLHSQRRGSNSTTTHPTMRERVNF